MLTFGARPGREKVMKFVDENGEFLLCVNTQTPPEVKEQLSDRMCRVAEHELRHGHSSDPDHQGTAQHCTEFYNRSSMGVSARIPAFRLLVLKEPQGSRLACVDNGEGKWNVVRVNDDGSRQEVPQTFIGPRSSKELLDGFDDYREIVGDAVFQVLLKSITETVSPPPTVSVRGLQSLNCTSSFSSSPLKRCCICPWQSRHFRTML